MVRYLGGYQPREEKLTSLAYGFLIPFFFIYTGIQSELNNIVDKATLIFIAKLLVGAFIVKIIPVFILKFKKVSWQNAAGVGVLLSARLSLIIAAAAIGLQKGFISSHLSS
ncbi:MAG: cation:proton antiporter [Candidatus Desulfofervidaceae bacterium]|nr:cation:proton antiporter [Candidatus Desulfofervidaceae bacterium]